MKYYETDSAGVRHSKDSAYDKVFVETVTASTTFTADDLGKTILVGTDALVMTLPAITADMVGGRITFRNSGADGAAIITISPAATDAIIGTIANAAADSVSGGVVNKDIVNTKATANKGDYIVLEAGALTAWYIAGGVGIWASEG
jgi:hypothetical protein